MKRSIKFLIIFCVLLAAVSFGIWRDFQGYMYTSTKMDKDVTSFIIPKGASFNEILQSLADQSIIKKPLYFKVFARMHKLGGQIKAGEYSFAKDLTPEQILYRLVDGKSIQHSFTIIEGTTIKQLREMLKAQTEIIRQVIPELSDTELLDELEIEDQTHPEGLFLADTFQVERGTSDLDLLRRSHDALYTLLMDLWANRDKNLPYKTPYEALILASIVEKETAVAEERPRIAGVFLRRMKIGMRLQTDPTVIYGMGDKYTGNITRKDLRTPTPYNTYTIDGLPPTPIAFVGPQALKAVFKPEMGNWLYFVAKGDGRHQFSATLSEHNNAVRAYQLKRKEAYRSTPEPQ